MSAVQRPLQMAISFPLSILPSILLLALALVTSSYLFTTRHQSSLTPTEDIELHPELFYPQLRKRKLFTGVLVVLLLALSGWRIGWEAIAADVGHEIRWIGILDQILAASFCVSQYFYLLRLIKRTSCCLGHRFQPCDE